MKNYEINPSPRTLMSPGPVDADPRVLRAMSAHILGQFDPEFTRIMEETQEMLREVFGTQNRQTFVVDTTSRGGIEAVLAGAVCPGDRVLVPSFGRFGYLLAEILERLGADVTLLEREWGTVFEPEEICKEVNKGIYKAVAVIHGETSTSMMQPLSDIGAVCRQRDVLLIADTVATLGGVEVLVDEWGIDGCIAGTQKCVSAPSGSSLITCSERIERIVNSRKRVEKGIRSDSDEDGSLPYIPSNYLDLGQLQDYWSPRRLNHHTEASSMQYAVHEALRCILLEGLDERYARHRRNDRALCAGLEAMGLKIFGDRKNKMPVVTAFEIPKGIDGAALRGGMLEDFGIEVATSFGPLHGRVIRIGNMGYSSQKRNILFTLCALEATLVRMGFPAPPGKAVDAALDVYKTPDDSFVQISG